MVNVELSDEEADYLHWLVEDHIESLEDYAAEWDDEDKPIFEDKDLGDLYRMAYSLLPRLPTADQR